MATTGVAYGKVMIAARAGESIPLGWAVDSDGVPTQSAERALAGAILPAAGAKGFGLAFMIDALLAAGGATTSPGVSALRGDPSAPQRLGQLVLALDAPDPAFADAIDALVGSLRASRRPNGPEVLYPGEPEQQRQRANGGSLDLPAELESELTALAGRLGVRGPRS
jgi:LDH2 family malate/lactate/ureidoglycolate dehydrogenase